MDKPEYALYTAAGVRELDRQAIEVEGIPGYELMNRAAAAVFAALRTRYPQEQRLNILCGAGNNAGDGYVLARLAREAGFEVLLLAISPVEKLHGDAAQAAADYLVAGGEATPFTEQFPASSGIAVDALLGTGLDRAVRGLYASAIGWINSHPGPVVAVDLPTGIHADTGTVMGLAVQADLTVSFIGQKQGLYTAQGPDHCGELLFADLDVPGKIYTAVPVSCNKIHDKNNWFSKRKRNSHKGSYGHVLAMGGAPGYPGAIRLCGEAALRSGAGLVSLATHPEHAAFINVSRPELMIRAITEPADLATALEVASVLAAGPGLGRGAWGEMLWKAVLAADQPAVVDADALNFLADSERLRSRWVLTPHPGEAARLLDTDTAAVQADRFAAARELARRYDAVVVLKGCGSLVCDPQGQLALCDAGNPGMASGGMGDVLTGIIAALLAQGMSLFDAACAGVWAHATAADRAAGALGERGLLATDLFPALHSVVNRK